MWLLQPWYRRKLRRRGLQEPGYLVAMPERFGHYATPLAAHAGPTVWIHAVSLGETRAVAVLITTLRSQWPTMRLLLTHGTATGRAEGVKLLQAGDLQAWQPWDTPAAVKRFLNHFKPNLGVLMETEVWPNLVHKSRALGVPLVMVNARLSDKSLHQALRLAWLARPAYAGLCAVWAQTPADAQRLTELGAPVKGVLGNLKFDAAPNAVQLLQGQAWRKQLNKPVLMLASSREGEELALLQLLKTNWTLTQQNNGLDAIDSIVSKVQWLIVPRHPQRFESVAELIETSGFKVSRRSDWLAHGPALVRSEASSSSATTTTLPGIWLGDSLGEMALYYGLADVALLGGSFEPLGGQNLIEAAACGCPVVMGPHTFNFAEAAEQALAAGAAQRSANLAQALDVACVLANQPSALAQARQTAFQFAQSHQGAAQRLSHELGHLLSGGAQDW